MSEGFDIATQQEQAKEEDAGITIEIQGVDELPVTYTNLETNEVMPVTITVAGAHSSIMRRVESAIRRRKLKPRQITGEGIFDDNIEKAVACTLDWQGFLNDGEEIEMTPKNIRILYTRCPWVYEQVLEAMHDHARFFGTASPQLVDISNTTQD